MIRCRLTSLVRSSTRPSFHTPSIAQRFSPSPVTPTRRLLTTTTPLASPTTIISTGILHHLDDLKDSFICHPSESAWHISLIQDLLTYMHTDLHLPWYSTIMLTTIAFRTLLIPLNISLVRNSARLNNIRPKLETLSKRFYEAKEKGDEREKEVAAKEIYDLFVNNKCSPGKNIIAPLVMTPIFLSVFMAWERLIVFTPDMTSGGALWFENLQATDPSFMLPVLSALTWIATFKFGADKVRTPRAAEFESLCAYLSLAMIPVTQVLPQGVFLYWLSSNVYSLAFIVLSRRPRIRQWLNIPKRIKIEDKY